MDWKTEKGLGDGPSGGGRRVFMIAGEKVILRALEKEDLERCYRWVNDPQIVHTLKSRYPMAIEKESEWLEHAIHSDARQRHFAVERRDDRSHIGNASLHEIDWISRVSSFGMFIGEPAAWNKGFGSDTIRWSCLSIWNIPFRGGCRVERTPPILRSALCSLLLFPFG